MDLSPPSIKSFPFERIAPNAMLIANPYTAKPAFLVSEAPFGRGGGVKLGLMA